MSTNIISHDSNHVYSQRNLFISSRFVAFPYSLWENIRCYVRERGRKLANVAKHSMNKTFIHDLISERFSLSHVDKSSLANSGCLTMTTITPMIPCYLLLLFCFDWENPGGKLHPVHLNINSCRRM